MATSEAMQHLLSLRHPQRMAASPGGDLTITLQGPGFFETQVIAADGQTVLNLPGVSRWVWCGAELIYADGEEILRWDGAQSQPIPQSEGCFIGGDSRAFLLREEVLYTYEQGGWRLVKSGFGRPIKEVQASPGGRTLLRELMDSDTSGVRVLGIERSYVQAGWCAIGAEFIDEDSVLLSCMSRDSAYRRVLRWWIDSDRLEILSEQFSPQGLLKVASARAQPLGLARYVAYYREVEGWLHLCVQHLETCEETIVLPGAHEDNADIDDVPQFSPDGRYLAFNSSHGNLRERRPYVFDTHTVETQQLEDLPGCSSQLTWLAADRLAYVHTGPEESAMVRMLKLGTSVQSLKLSQAKGIPPQPLSLPTPEGGVVYADLYLPPNLDRNHRNPALVYLHGGIYRQMVRGFHPSYTYSLLHLVNQHFLEQGYVVLSVDYRGSTGYGQAYEQANHKRCAVAEAEDALFGRNWLASQPYVDPKRMGVWGLSWGGTIVLEVLTRFPEAFAAGINLAGIWDLEQRAHFWEAKQPGEPIYMRSRMGLLSDAQARERYQECSARAYRHNWCRPLLSLHGTADEAVDYAQQTLLEHDAQELGKPLESHSLEGESHLFSRRVSWEFALGRMTEFFNAHLR